MRLMSTNKPHSKELSDEDCRILPGLSTDTARCCFRPLPDMLSLCEIEAERNALWPLRKPALSGSLYRMWATDAAICLVLEHHRFLFPWPQRPMPVAWATASTTRHPRSGGVMPA